MGVDLQKQKEKKQEEARKVAERLARQLQRTVQRWKPKTGESKIRLMPPWTSEGHNANNFANEVYLHWHIPGISYPVLCVAQTPGQEGVCPVCELYEQLKASDSPEDQELAKEVRAKVSYDSNIVDLKDPVYKQTDVDAFEEENPGVECPFTVGSTKVQVWSYGVTLYKNFLDIFASGVDITDLSTGFNINLTREGKTRENTKYRMILEPDRSPFVPKGDIDLMEKIYNLDAMHQAKDPDELRALVSGEVSPEKALTPKTAPKALAAAVSEDVEEEVVPVAVKKKGPSMSDMDKLQEQLKAAVKQK